MFFQDCAPTCSVCDFIMQIEPREERRRRRRIGEDAEQAAEHVREVSLSVTDEDWQRRHEKRLRVVDGTKSTLEYQRMSDKRERGELSLGTAAPSTPDANDRQVSKREWERLVMNWRMSLRQYSSDFNALTLTTIDEAQLRHELAMAELEFLLQTE